MLRKKEGVSPRWCEQLGATSTHTHARARTFAQRSGITHTERELYNLLQGRALQGLDDEPFRDGFVGGRVHPPSWFLFDRAVCAVCVRYARASVGERSRVRGAGSDAGSAEAAGVAQVRTQVQATRQRTRRARARARAAAPSAARAAASTRGSSWSALGFFAFLLPILAFDRLLCAGISRRQSRCETWQEAHDATSSGQARRRVRAARVLVREGAERAADAEGQGCRERPLFASRGSTVRV